jgi:hypothetical protein
MGLVRIVELFYNGVNNRQHHHCRCCIGYPQRNKCGDRHKTKHEPCLGICKKVMKSPLKILYLPFRVGPKVEQDSKCDSFMKFGHFDCVGYYETTKKKYDNVLRIPNTLILLTRNLTLLALPHLEIAQGYFIRWQNTKKREQYDRKQRRQPDWQGACYPKHCHYNYDKSAFRSLQR